MLKFQILLNAKYKLYSVRSYIKLPKELDHVVKRLVIIQNIDSNECFKWFLVRYLNSEDYHPAKMRKFYKNFSKIT